MQFHFDTKIMPEAQNEYAINHVACAKFNRNFISYLKMPIHTLFFQWFLSICISILSLLRLAISF